MATDHRPRLSDAVFEQLHDRKAHDESINDVVKRLLERDTE